MTPAKAFAECGVSGKWRSERPRDGHVFVTDGGHWIVDEMPRVWRAFWAQSRVLSSTVCSSVSPARPFWRVRKEFALLSGSDAAAFQGETE